MYCTSGNIRAVLHFHEFLIFTNFANLAKIIIIALLKKNENSRILNLKSPKIKNSRQFKVAKITRSTGFFFTKHMHH